MDARYDFSPLWGRMSREESARRRRAILGGRSVVTAMQLEHWALLVLLVLPWIVVVVGIGIVVVSSITWVAVNGPTPDYLLGVPLLALASVAAVALLVFLTRLCIIPPRWGQWVRMHRFAEVNGLEFTRELDGVELPLNLRGNGMTPRVFDSFRDPETGLRVGNWVRPTISGRGVADWRAFVYLPAEASAGEEPFTRPEVRPLTGFEVRSVGTATIATKFPSVRMRNGFTVERMFATADAIRRGDLESIV